MIVATLSELEIVGIFDRGVPNKERVVLKANELVNLGRFGLMLCLRGNENGGFPIRDNLFWFGDFLLGKDDWIFLYTDPGLANTTVIPNTQSRLYTLHWGRPTTILNNPNVLVMLFAVDAVLVSG